MAHDKTGDLEDLAVLREQLKFIGDTLAGVPDPDPVRRGRGRRLVLALAASVSIGALGIGGGAYLVANNGRVGGEGEMRLTPEGSVACAKVIAEGTVARVEPLEQEGKLRVVLNADRYYKPDEGRPQVVFTAENEDYFRPGVRMLVLVSQFTDEGPNTYREGDPAPPREAMEGLAGAADVSDALEWGRKWVTEALPGSRGVECTTPG
ncbi:hypothetical protein [Streptomyces sp. NPDC002205]|uniref:hypothetical protein n=1 Tax=Streptomyces sp. NPDC002205 TaxID=3154411 RepID=UPI003321F271